MILLFDKLPQNFNQLIIFRASVLLTRDLITENGCKPTTAIQLLTALPFHITEISADLVSECEPLMRLSKIQSKQNENLMEFKEKYSL